METLDSAPASTSRASKSPSRQRTKACTGLEQPVTAGLTVSLDEGILKFMPGDSPNGLVHIRKFVGIQEHVAEVNDRRVVGQPRSIGSCGMRWQVGLADR